MSIIIISITFINMFLSHGVFLYLTRNNFFSSRGLRITPFAFASGW